MYAGEGERLAVLICQASQVSSHRDATCGDSDAKIGLTYFDCEFCFGDAVILIFTKDDPCLLIGAWNARLPLSFKLEEQ